MPTAYWKRKRLGLCILPSRSWKTTSKPREATASKNVLLVHQGTSLSLHRHPHSLRLSPPKWSEVNQVVQRHISSQTKWRSLQSLQELPHSPEAAVEADVCCLENQSLSYSMVQGSHCIHPERERLLQHQPIQRHCASECEMFRQSSVIYQISMLCG